jgi:PAS domain S-box-containing protein
MEQIGNTDSLFEHILHGITDSVLIISKDLNILWANKSFTDQTGYSLEEIIGKHCFTITHRNENPCASPDDLCPISDSLKTGESATTTHTHYDKEGNKVFVEVSAYPVRDKNGEIVQFGYFLRDLTDHKRTEKELMKYQQHLEDLIEERTAMLKAATEKLQEEITERKIAAEEISRTKTYLESILNNSMDLVVTVKKDGTISYVNPQSEVITGYRPGEVRGKYFIDFIPEYLREFVLQKWEETNKGIPGRYETEMIKADGTLMHCLVSQSPMEGFDEILISLKDITRRKVTEEALLKSYGEMEMRVKERTAALEKLNEELLNEIAERNRTEGALRKSEASLSEAQRIAHLGNWDWNIETDQLHWSDEIYRIFGLSPQQFGATYEAFLNSVHPDDREFINSAVKEALSGNKPYYIDHRIVLPDGTVRIVHEQAEVTFHETGKPIRMIGTVQDVTDSKRAEEELKESYEQLRKLSAHLHSVREEERTNIAREIHDELGQVLTAMKIEGSILLNSLRSDKKSFDKIESIVKRIDDTIQSVKKICTRLRPTILDHFGLSAAIEWQIEEFKNLTGIKVTTSFEPREIVLNQDLSTPVFRIFQEALTNIARHADATEARVSLKLKDGNILLEVKDNGKGIAKKEFSDTASFGIIGIKERVHYFGGDVTINGIMNKGTTLTVSIPLSNKEV